MKMNFFFENDKCRKLYRSSTKRLAAVHILKLVYCRVGSNGTGDIAAPLARRDHRIAGWPAITCDR